MAAIHSFLGVLLIVLSIVVLIWNILRASGRVHSNRLRMPFIGLLDLQILLGIVTYILHPKGGLFLLHPIFMIVGVVLLHIYSKESRSMRTQLTTYAVTTAVFIVGFFLGGLH